MCDVKICNHDKEFNDPYWCSAHRLEWRMLCFNLGIATNSNVEQSHLFILKDQFDSGIEIRK